MAKLRNITLSADPDLIEQARRKAIEHNTTLNAIFREWLASYTAKEQAQSAYDNLMRRLGHVWTDQDLERWGYDDS